MAKVNKGVGSKHPKAKLSVADVRKIRKLLVKGTTTQTQIAKDFGISLTALGRIKNGTSYKDVV